MIFLSIHFADSPLAQVHQPDNLTQVYHMRGNLMADEKKDQRVTLMMTPTELQRLDDWAFGQRIRSRGEAIRRLIAAAIVSHSRAGSAAFGATHKSTGNQGER